MCNPLLWRLLRYIGFYFTNKCWWVMVRLWGCHYVWPTSMHYVTACVWLTSGVMWTGCRLVTLSWVPGSVLAIWEVACTTDLCWYKEILNLFFQVILFVCLFMNTYKDIHFTCWAVCTCWTTWVGTPVCTTAGGGLESDTLSLEWREPSEENKDHRYSIIL